MSMSLSNDAGIAYLAAIRSPRLSFAARLAALQARQQRAPSVSAAIAAAGRAALAAIPAGALAWLFVCV